MSSSETRNSPSAKPKPRARKPKTPSEIIRDGALIDATVVRAVRSAVGKRAGAGRPARRKFRRAV